MYGGGPILVREDPMDIYSREIHTEYNGGFSTKNRPGAVNLKNIKPSSSNIFQPQNRVQPAVGGASNSNSQSAMILIASSEMVQQTKKRNLFQSENIGVDDDADLGIPEENFPRTNIRIGI